MMLYCNACLAVFDETVDRRCRECGGTDTDEAAKCYACGRYAPIDILNNEELLCTDCLIEKGDLR